MAENDPPSAETVDDLASLMHLDEASMLENLRTRYVEDRIYVSHSAARHSATFHSAAKHACPVLDQLCDRPNV